MLRCKLSLPPNIQKLYGVAVTQPVDKNALVAEGLRHIRY